MADIHHFKNFSVKRADMTADINMSRLENNFNYAQYMLDSMVMTSMEPFMPMQDGSFIKKTKTMSAAIAGTGVVVAAAPPNGRFLYDGKTMVDPKTGSPWARRGAKKVLVSQYSGKTNARENLSYSRGSAKAHWFDAAKDVDGKQWVKKTKKIAGGG